MMQKIKGSVQHYSWGGNKFLPGILNHPNPDDIPFAEYWLGTHSLAPSKLIDSSQTLTDFLKDKGQYGLPFLFKVLDVKDMLSIQAHPNKQLAENGFEKENEQGIPLNSPKRTFKDSNHKPEIMVALSDFWLMQGFQPEESISNTLSDYPEFVKLASIYGKKGLKELCHYILHADQQEINAILRPLGKRLKPIYESGSLDRSQIDFWSARAFITFNRKGFCDRGIIFLYLMNLVHLVKGEATYQRPGLLHSYLEGQNIECMTTSDNVMRAGLTQKYCDIAAFMECVEFTYIESEIIKPVRTDTPGMWSYPCPSDVFSLYRMDTSRQSIKIKEEAYAILMVLRGNGHLNNDAFAKGDAFLTLPGEAYELTSEEEASIFRAVAI